MQTYSHQYHKNSLLQSFVDKNELASAQQVLVQITTDSQNRGPIQTVTKQLNQMIPHARILRTMMAEGIKKESQVKVLLSFTTFEETTVNELVLQMTELVTKQKQDHEEIIRLAYHDDLTGLPNRLLFQQTLDRSMEQAKRLEEEMAVMFIDLDRFKVINDSVGHHRGDQILKQAAARIQRVMDKDHFLSRFNGDEFIVLLPQVDNIETVRRVARDILKAFKTPVMNEGWEFFLSVSIGVSLYPHDSETGGDLMKSADTALNLAKQRGGDRIQFYKQEMKNYFTDRLELEGYLRKALEKQELSLFYQPLICVNNGRVFGGEALIRWHHPKHGLMSPDIFIPIAEETGLIEGIGRWVLKTACHQAKQWQENGYPGFSISVNVSPRQFQRRRFLDEVKDALAESGLASQYLHLEFTESITLKDVRHSMHHMKALKMLGVKVSIDDFGTGYSSLSYLKDFTIDILKIDRSFIRNLRKGSHDGAIIKAILTMCDGLALTAIAEGVETEEQLNILKTFGCSYVQGFFYSKPLPVDQFQDFLNERNAEIS